MRVVFAGSPPFAVPSLEGVADRFELSAVLTTPDRVAGRGRRRVMSAVKQRALEMGLPILQPDRIDAAFERKIAELNADVLAVAAMGTLFRTSFLRCFPKGGVNLHPSLLPKFRGPSPIPAAILAGERQTGVTIQRIAAAMDSGDILARKAVMLSGTETTMTLAQRLAVDGAQLFSEVLEQVAAGSESATPQIDADATYCRLITKDQGVIDWNRSATDIERMIRAYDPWPRAYSTFEGVQLVLWSGFVGEAVTNDPPGMVLDVDSTRGILVATANGTLGVTRLQLQAKKPLDWKSFLNGHRNFIGARLGEPL